MSHKRPVSDRSTPTQLFATATIELMIEQQVANTLATYEANWNNASEQSRIRSNNHRNNSYVPRSKYDTN